ncbi:outer membrane beta-barrel protein [Acetobacter oryzoeni]|uniref:Outer membrane beta-barrel protein n=1 Tax=Acetobacter oryzoeni TaxID=2500548 RepID=A0A5B9GTE6_9PROT|nr:outer membrane beta-barrel protein [Acetobacter oryzoeni]MCP1203797.1 porin [Acetobacter oryzoeni]QEE86805.1 outer membrane beta-barrel protein [Acetobacter oryzoeni]
MRQTKTDRSAFKFVLLSCCAAFLCETGTSVAHAQTSAPAQVQVGDIAKTLKPEEAEKGAGTPTDGEEPPATSLSEEEEAMKPKAGNLFHVKPGHTPTYWEGLEGHVSIEAGISGNPWTRSGRNFAQYYSDRANTVTLNQIIGSLSHPVTSVGSGYGIGFVLEAMYGSDARFDPTIGMGSGSLHGLYQWAPTQAHLDVHLPWIFKRGIDVQIGQMYGIMGAEGTPALARPFYTYNYASDYIVPFQTVGILATMHLTRHMDWILGVDAGNSTTFGASGNNNKPKGYFGLAWNKLMDGKLDVHAIGHFGPQGNNGRTIVSPTGWVSAGIGKQANSLMQYNADVMATYHINDKMTVSVDGTYLHDDSLRDDAYGVTTYFSYDIHPWLTFNARGEIFRDNTGGVITEYSSFNSLTQALSNQPFPYYNALPTTYGELTVGVSYRPEFVNKRLALGGFTIRPEIRLDKSLNGTHPFNQAGTVQNPTVNNGTNNMLWFSCDATWSF